MKDKKRKRHIKSYVKGIEVIPFCGTNIIKVNTTGNFEKPFEIEPIEGEHDFNTCKGCQTSIKEITKNLKKRFDGYEGKQGFPFCCTPHSNLIKLKEFDRASFEKVPEMVAKKIIYTNQQITNKYGSESWYKDVTDYIEWAIMSFGQMPENCGTPLYVDEYLNPKNSYYINRKGCNYRCYIFV